jgi:hypothetical protein
VVAAVKLGRSVYVVRVADAGIAQQANTIKKTRSLNIVGFLLGTHFTLSRVTLLSSMSRFGMWLFPNWYPKRKDSLERESTYCGRAGVSGAN